MTEVPKESYNDILSQINNNTLVESSASAVDTKSPHAGQEGVPAEVAEYPESREFDNTSPQGNPIETSETRETTAEVNESAMQFVQNREAQAADYQTSDTNDNATEANPTHADYDDVEVPTDAPTDEVTAATESNSATTTTAAITTEQVPEAVVEDDIATDDDTASAAGPAKTQTTPRPAEFIPTQALPQLGEKHTGRNVAVGAVLASLLAGGAWLGLHKGNDHETAQGSDNPKVSAPAVPSKNNNDKQPGKTEQVQVDPARAVLDPSVVQNVKPMGSEEAQTPAGRTELMNRIESVMKVGDVGPWTDSTRGSIVTYQDQVAKDFVGKYDNGGNAYASMINDQYVQLSILDTGMLETSKFFSTPLGLKSDESAKLLGKAPVVTPDTFTHIYHDNNGVAMADKLGFGTVDIPGAYLAELAAGNSDPKLIDALAGRALTNIQVTNPDISMQPKDQLKNMRKQYLKNPEQVKAEVQSTKQENTGFYIYTATDVFLSDGTTRMHLTDRPGQPTITVVTAERDYKVSGTDHTELIDFVLVPAPTKDAATTGASIPLIVDRTEITPRDPAPIQ